MAFAIIAEFPLGTYRGRKGDGALDPLPSPARLHAALLNAAAQGVRADAAGSLAPNASDRHALVWLESNPPDALRVPATATNDGAPIAFRDMGFHEKWARKKLPGTSGGSIALAGPLAWIWSDDPPAAVREALTALCRDVPYLGTSESPVLLSAGEALATHEADRSASLFRGHGIEVDVAAPGRATLLEAAYRAAVGQVPTVAGDAIKQAETERLAPVERGSLRRLRYVGIEPMPPRVPWSSVVILPVDEARPLLGHVAWCVALHRALIGLIGDGAPALVTGRYDPGEPRPANRLAIQYLSGSLPTSVPLGPAGAFALLVPHGADPADLGVLGRAIRGLRLLRLNSTRAARISSEVTVVRGDEFWRPTPTGHIRLWMTEPAAVPETRRIRGDQGTLGDVALLSIGMVWRDELGGLGRGSGWYARLAEAALARGAEVLDAHKLHTSDVRNYVHRIAEGTVVQPYRATLRLGTLVGNRTVVAIGQSRHLGGGLLVPRDLPEDEAEQTDDAP